MAVPSRAGDSRGRAIARRADVSGAHGDRFVTGVPDIGARIPRFATSVPSRDVPRDVFVTHEDAIVAGIPSIIAGIPSSASRARAIGTRDEATGVECFR